MSFPVGRPPRRREAPPSKATCLARRMNLKKGMRFALVTNGPGSGCTSTASWPPSSPVHQDGAIPQSTLRAHVLQHTVPQMPRESKKQTPKKRAKGGRRKAVRAKDPPKFTMEFEPRTIEHLGLRLYNTLPPVIVELVTNAFDAESPKVEVLVPTGEISPSSEIVVRDFGHGMNDEEIQDEYLPIGRNRRGLGSSRQLSKNGKRAVTGRKGLGKLSAFGIAEEMEIRSISNRRATTLRLNYSEMQQWAKSHPKQPYEPEYVAERSGATEEPDGVEVSLRRLRRKYRINEDRLRIGIAQRLALIGTKFKVLVNGTAIKPSDRRRPHDCSPNFVWDVTDDLPQGASVGDGLTVRGWIGFVETSSQINRGIDIYANGKAAELESYFNFGSTHAQFARAHLVGEIHADFLDSAENDLIATARNKILWDEEDAHHLEVWGQSVLAWAFERWVERRRIQKEEELKAGTDFDKWLTSRTRGEQAVAQRMLKLLVNEERLDAPAVRPLLEIVKTGVETVHFRELVDALDSDQNSIAELLKLFDEWRVIEGRVHVQISDGRWSAMDTLESYIEQGALEVEQMQPLLAENPWLIDQRWSEVSVEQRYSKLLREQFPESDDTPASDRRIDILGMRESAVATVVEIKRPETKLKRDHLTQIEEYVDWMRDKVTGGSSSDGIKYVHGLLVVGSIEKGHQDKIRRLAGDDIRVETFADLYNAARVVFRQVEDTLAKLAPEYAKKAKDRRRKQKTSTSRRVAKKTSTLKKARSRQTPTQARKKTKKKSAKKI